MDVYEALLVAEVELELADVVEDEDAWEAAYQRYLGAAAEVRLMEQGVIL